VKVVSFVNCTVCSIIDTREDKSVGTLKTEHPKTGTHDLTDCYVPPCNLTFYLNASKFSVKNVGKI
jgi:hypothetical protein